MKKLLILFICLFINSAFSFNLKGDITTKYKTDTINNAKDKYIDSEDRTIGYLNIEGDLDLDFDNNFHLINTFEFKPINARQYNGHYGSHNAIINNSTLTDDFYGKEDYLKRKLYFNHYGLIMEELYFKYKEEAFLFGIGKYNPTFGYAYNSNRLNGVYGTQLAEDYELTEKIGTFLAFDSDFFILRGNLFFDDNTFLSEDLFKRRGINKSEYGAGNTKKLNNFSITSDLIYEATKLSASFRRLAVNKKEEKAENGYLMALQHYVEETKYSFGFNPLIEVAFFENFNGVINRDVYYSTISLPLFYKNWNIVGSHTFKNDKEKGFKDYQSYISQISIGYKFNSGLIISVARKWEKSAKKVSDLINTKEVKHYNSWGIEAFYNFKF